ncbi:hypothetical protein LINPERPRIM_LOCUS29137 [Linum perenne]
MASQAGFLSPKESEGLALLHALKWLNEKRATNTIIEVDALEVVRAVADGAEDVSEFGNIVRSCRLWLHPTFELRHVRRNRNEVAHALARRSRLLTAPCEGEVPPEWLVNALYCTCMEVGH